MLPFFLDIYNVTLWFSHIKLLHFLNTSNGVLYPKAEWSLSKLYHLTIQFKISSLALSKLSNNSASKSSSLILLWKLSTYPVLNGFPGGIITFFKVLSVKVGKHDPGKNDNYSFYLPFYWCNKSSLEVRIFWIWFDYMWRSSLYYRCSFK